MLAVSHAGELAISLGWHLQVGWEATGTLARVPLAGGAPREVLENVQDADWSPDGKELAVIHQTEARARLEYPVGTRARGELGLAEQRPGLARRNDWWRSSITPSEERTRAA